jgi:hypothetical protein
MVTGIDIPVRIGNTTAMPGDVVFSDREGVSFIPPHLVQGIIDEPEVTHIHDEWAKKKFDEGKYKSTDVYSRPRDPALLKEYQDYLKQKLGPAAYKEYMKRPQPGPPAGARAAIAGLLRRPVLVRQDPPRCWSAATLLSAPQPLACGSAGLTDESVCPTFVRKGLRFCGAGAFACQPISSQSGQGADAQFLITLCITRCPSAPRGQSRLSPFFRPARGSPLSSV